MYTLLINWVPTGYQWMLTNLNARKWSNFWACCNKNIFRFDNFRWTIWFQCGYFILSSNLSVTIYARYLMIKFIRAFWKQCVVQFLLYFAWRGEQFHPSVLLRNHSFDPSMFQDLSEHCQLSNQNVTIPIPEQSAWTYTFNSSCMELMLS